MSSRIELERALRRWLSSHHSVIGYHEARHLGATYAVVRHKADRGEWARLYKGVYRDTAAPTGPFQYLRAACVATAGRGVVSHRSAAWAWGLLRNAPPVPEVTVCTVGREVRSRPGLTVHRSRDLDTTAAVTRNAILVTNPLRTLVDLAAVVLPGELTEAVDNALARRLVTTPAVMAEMERLSRRGREGVGALRDHLKERGFVGAPEPSVLEAHTRRLIVSSGLPLPEIERTVGEYGQYRLDLSWGAVLFAIEVDGYVWHFTPEHKQRDDTRRNHLQQLGWTVLVYEWRDIVHEPDRVAREVTTTYRRLSRPG